MQSEGSEKVRSFALRHSLFDIRHSMSEEAISHQRRPFATWARTGRSTLGGNGASRPTPSLEPPLMDQLVRILSLRGDKGNR